MMHFRRTALALFVVLLVGAAMPASADTVESTLSVYTGDNAKNYLRPLHEAIGVALNSGMFYTARIPKDKFKISLELPVMGVLFGDDDRTFRANAEDPFIPLTPGDANADASTIVGPGTAQTSNGQGNTTFGYPGGFQLDSFALTVPQLRVSFKGTELVGRALVGVESGEVELGEVELFGAGLRHNISQYFGESPVDLAATGFYQTLSIGKNVAENDLVSVDAFSIGVNVSKDFPFSFMKFTPYGGVTYDSFQTEIEYQLDATSTDTQQISFDRENSVHFTVGAGLNLVAAQIFGQFDYSLRSSFLFGIALGNLGS